MALVLALAGLCFLRAGNARFTRTFDLEKLMAVQAIHPRSTAAFVGRGLKLSKLRAATRPADAALHADEWVARYATSEKSGFDEAAARREFMRQLGERWTESARGSPGALDARGLRPTGRPASRRSGSAAWIAVGRVAAAPKSTAGPGRKTARLRSEDASSRRSRARDGGSRRLGRRCHGQHHFTTPGLMSVLSQARLRSGVLAPAQFAFLKLVDRRSGRAACARLRSTRLSPPPSEHAGRGDRRRRPLGGRTRGRRADSDPGIQFCDRSDQPEDGVIGSRFPFAQLIRMLVFKRAPTGAHHGSYQTRR